jgi:2-polyprenyl-3-methyl-5-hydroxy-6-metoxy-1,4-benzoquinol methylase
MTDPNTPTCVLCGSTQWKHQFLCTDYTVSREQFRISICASCGAGQTLQAPPPESIGAYYQSDDYISHSDTREGLFNRAYHLSRSFMLGRKASLIRQISGLKTGQLLDIGCGTGYFLDTMQRKGWQVHGIEADAGARQFAQKRFGLEVQPAEALTSLPNETFQVISMWHVLEHLHDLHGYMAHIRRVLTDSGLLVIAVPNHLSSDALHYGSYWAGWDVPRHLWHFTPNSMQVLAEKSGFTLMDTRTMPLDPFYVSLLSERYKHNGQGKPLSALWQGLRSMLRGFADSRQSSSVIYLMLKG